MVYLSGLVNKTLPVPIEETIFFPESHFPCFDHWSSGVRSSSSIDLTRFQPYGTSFPVYRDNDVSRENDRVIHVTNLLSIWDLRYGRFYAYNTHVWVF